MLSNHFNKKNTAFAMAVAAFAQASNALQLSAQVAQDDSMSASGSCNVLNQGEIRPFNYSSKAMQYQWVEGEKIVSPTNEIVASELVMRYCDDLTIRDHTNHCVSADVSLGYKNVLTTCNVLDASQQFELVSESTDRDSSLLAQQRLNLRNRASGNCFGQNGGSSDAVCEEGNYFRSKGGLVHSGKFQNVSTLKCLTPVELEDQAKMTSADCQDDDSNLQSFSYYENGEIIHDATGLCLGKISEQSTDFIIIAYCEDVESQIWTEAVVDGALYYISFAEEMALSSDAVGDDITNTEWAMQPLQQWRYVGSGEWAEPQFSWIAVGCDQGVDLTHMYQQAMFMVNPDSTQSEVTDDEADSLKNALLYETILPNGIPVSADAVQPVYQTLSEMVWHPSDPYVDKQHAFNCGEFEDGTPHENGGCLWRSLMTVHNWFENQDLYWHTPLTKCTPSGEPVCPPLTKCADVSCTECVLAGYSHPQ